MATNHDIITYSQNSILSADELLMNKFFPPQIKWFSKGVNNLYKISPNASFKMTMAALSISIKRPLKEKDRVFYAKGVKKTFRCKHKSFNTYAYGEGPEVYFVHGWVSSGARWKLYVESVVKQGYKAIIIDAPSHGTSPGMFLSLPDYIVALRHVFNNSNNLHAVINHSIGSLCSIVALKESIISKPCKIALLSSFNSAEVLLNKFARSIGIKEQIIKDIVPWMPRYAGYDISYLNVSKHLENLGKDIFMVYDRDDIVVPSIETITLLNEHPNINYYPTFGLGHNLRSLEIIKAVVNFIAN